MQKVISKKKHNLNISLLERLFEEWYRPSSKLLIQFVKSLLLICWFRYGKLCFHHNVGSQLNKSELKLQLVRRLRVHCNAMNITEDRVLKNLPLIVN